MGPNVVSVLGGKVHSSMREDDHPFPLCRTGSMTNAGTKYRTTDAPLSCKTCITYAERRAAKAAETAITEESQSMDTEQIAANIERVATLVAEGSQDAALELEHETETLISAIKGKGSVAVRKQMRDDLAKAVAPKAEPKVHTPEPITWESFAGTKDLVTKGAEAVAEGVRLHLKASDTAKAVAAIRQDLWLLLPDSDGNPDLMGRSQLARDAAKALYIKAGEGFEQDEETAEALRKLQRAVQYQGALMRTALIKSLDTDEAARARFAKVLVAAPKNAKASEYVAEIYGTSTKDRVEWQRDYNKAQKAVPAARAAELPPLPDDPNEAAMVVVERIAMEIEAATPERVKKVSDAEVKNKIRTELEALRARIAELEAALNGAGE